MFSRRLPPHTQINELTKVLARCQADGVEIADLTESNPTRAGIVYPADLLEGLEGPASFQYAPHPFGAPPAREAIAIDYKRRAGRVDPDHVVLTASTSEAYTWLFKLLCDPGESVLVPRPSYPLFEHLTRLEGVTAASFELEYHGRWEIDLSALHVAPATTRAVVLVSPNNPTGSFVTARELAGVLEVCRERGWAVIADEVFADYTLDVLDPLTDIALKSDVLAFTLGGLSKSVGLPQLKLGWIVVGGPAAARNQALTRLEIIADAFLSVSTPTQVAAPSLIDRGRQIRCAIHERVRSNLATLRELATGFRACEVLRLEGGWSAVIRVPATRSEDALVLGLLTQEHVLVHPGYFFDFPREAFVVVSLLPPTDVFRAASTRLLRFACS